MAKYLNPWAGSRCYLNGYITRDGTRVQGHERSYFASGVRPSELRLTEFRNLDMVRKSLHVRHSKSKGPWASAETVDPIRGDVIPQINRYLGEREAHVRERGATKATALFPNLHRGKDGLYSVISGGRHQEGARKEWAIDLRINDFRPTLTTLTVSHDVSRLPAMLVQLRHTSVSTTQKYNADIDQRQAGKKLKNIWRESGP